MEKSHPEAHNQEIDLFLLLNQMVAGTYRFLTRHYKTLLIAGITGGIFGTAIYFLFQKNLYQTQIIAFKQKDFPSSKVLLKMIDNLNELNISNKTLLQKKLNLSAQEAQNIQNIKADTLDTSKYIQITISYKDSLNIQNLSKNIPVYIDSNPLIKKELEIEKQSRITMLKCYEEELLKVDSMQKMALATQKKRSKEASNRYIVLNGKPEHLYHKDIINLRNSKLTEEEALQHMSVVEVVEYQNETKIKKRSLTDTCINYILLFLAIGLLYTLAVEMVRKAKRLENTETK